MAKLVVYIDSLNASGGIERIVSQLISCWKNRHDVIIISKDDGKCFYPGTQDVKRITLNTPRIMNMNFRMQRVVGTIINSFRSIFALRKTLKTLDYSYIYVATPLNALEVYCSGAIGEKIIVAEHGSAYGVNRIYSIMKKYIYPKVKAISVPNKLDTELYNKCGYNAVYIPHIVLNKQNSRNILNSKIVLNIGRLTPDKRQDLLILSWAKIHANSNWKLLIVGDGEQKEFLQEIIKDNKLEKSVFIKDATAKIDEYYKKASIFALSSRFEGFGLVLVEAMSYGLPCVSFDCPSGPRDIISNGFNGFLVRNGDIDQYALKLDELIHFPEKELNEMGANAYNSIMEWDNDHILKKWDILFQKIGDQSET